MSDYPLRFDLDYASAEGEFLCTDCGAEADTLASLEHDEEYCAYQANERVIFTVGPRTIELTYEWATLYGMGVRCPDTGVSFTEVQQQLPDAAKQFGCFDQTYHRYYRRGWRGLRWIFWSRFRSE